jgi:hypoxanthine phosphoribosyltransferase
MGEMRYLDTITASNYLNITLDNVRRLIRNQQLVAKKEGTVLKIHTVDIHRLKKLHTAVDHQDENKPDILWVQEACNYIIKEISKSGFIPKQIIAIANGGLVPASIIAATIRLDNFVSIKVTAYESHDKLEQVTIDKIPSTIQQVATLIVDDITDSGDTLTLMKKELEVIGITDIKFAALHKRPDSQFKLDWYAAETENWITYPWEST